MKRQKPKRFGHRIINDLKREKEFKPINYIVEQQKMLQSSMEEIWPILKVATPVDYLF